MALLRSNAQMEMGKDKSFLALAAATMPPRAMYRAAAIISRWARLSHHENAAVAAAAAFCREARSVPIL